MTIKTELCEMNDTTIYDHVSKYVVVVFVFVCV